jgi:hypothetical protein
MITTSVNVLAPQVFVQIADFNHHLGVIFEINSSSLLQVARVALVFWSGCSLTNTLLFIEMLLSIHFCVNNTHSDAHRAEIRTHTSESAIGEADFEPLIGACRDNLHN